MDLLGFQSLIGILITEVENKLTPFSSDVFVSIPERDSTASHNWVRFCPLTNIITSFFSIDIFNC